MCMLTPLTYKEVDSYWPGWDASHQAAFDAIKVLVLSCECLTVIDHNNPSNNRIFFTTDTSDWWTGAVL